MFAAIRPDSINIALLVHVAGALTLVGALLTTVGIGLSGWNDGTAVLSRLAYRVLLYVAFPAWIVMRIGAEWVYSKEHLDQVKPDPNWVSVGFTTADGGGLLLLIALIVGGIGLRRSRSGRTNALLKVSSVLATLLVLAYVVALWAMGAKPS